MFIPRDLYLQRLIARKKNGFIKVITGIRRSGKSFLLFKIFKDYLLSSGVKEENIVEVQLDNIAFAHLREPKALYDYLMGKIPDDTEVYILLDEIQYVDDFVDVLNGLLYLDHVDVYVTGSNSKFLSTDILTEFRGRGDEVRVYPLSFSEYSSRYEGNFDEALDDYLVYGGLPSILSFPTDEQKSRYLKNLFEETYLVDIIERNNVMKEDDLRDLIHVLASSIGSLTNPNKLENTFKSTKKSSITRDTIARYIDYLKEAFIIEEALRYDIKGKKYINTPFKYYFTDTGLRNARLNFRQIEETHLMENIIFNELKIRGFDVDVGNVDIREKNKEEKFIRKQLEVDFIAYKGSKKYYIQSAFALPDEDKKEQEKRPLKEIDDSFKKLIILRNNQKPRRDENGILTISLQEFLLNPGSLDL